VAIPAASWRGNSSGGFTDLRLRADVPGDHQPAQAGRTEEAAYPRSSQRNVQTVIVKRIQVETGDEQVTRDDIVLLARKADLWITSDERWAAVVRFANLVAAAEREECAQICEVIRGKDMQPAWDTAAAHCTAAIRARGEE